MTTDHHHAKPPTWGGRHGFAALLGVALLTLICGPGLADAVETRLAGSAQLDYLTVPTNTSPREITFDGFTTELSLKLAVDVNEHVSASVKVCSSCHGLETGLAVVDLTVNDWLSFRAGRFTARFGDFPFRHDPANHRTSDKPLPYDMGRMLRMRDWNMSVLPAPYVDNGVELIGHHQFGEHFELDWSAYVVGGMRGNNRAADVDFVQSRSGERYYVDNNSSPTVGGRVVGLVLGDRNSFKLGLSGMTGTIDPARQLDYLLLGVDAVLKLDRLTLRAEYLLRRQRLGVGADRADEYVYGPGKTGGWDPYFLKDGFYVEAQYPIGAFDIIARFDGMTRVGNVPVGSTLGARAWIVRNTLGASWLMHKRVRWKTSLEWYKFSNFDDELALHLGMVSAF